MYKLLCFSTKGYDSKTPFQTKDYRWEGGMWPHRCLAPSVVGAENQTHRMSFLCLSSSCQQNGRNPILLACLCSHFEVAWAALGCSAGRHHLGKSLLLKEHFFFIPLANLVSHWHKLWNCCVGEFISFISSCLTVASPPSPSGAVYSGCPFLWSAWWQDSLLQPEFVLFSGAALNSPRWEPGAILRCGVWALELEN